MAKAIWITGDDRACVLRPFAMRLWDARDVAKVRGGSVQFPGGDYTACHEEPNEFSSGTSRLRADGNTFMMAMGADHMTQAFDALTAWRLIALMTKASPALPSSITIPEGPARQMRRPGPAGWLLGKTKTVRQPAYQITDQMQVARYECGRILHDRIVAEEAHPAWGRLDMTVGRDIEVFTRSPMTASHPDGGETRIHPAWLEPIRKAIATAQRADAKWTSAERHHASQPEYGWEF